MADFQAIIN